jgi:DNA-binding response OmpR family regulator
VSRILIAEDEHRITDFLEKGLRAAGYTTTTALDGVQALALARTGNFDLVLLDIGLPKTDGFTVLRNLRGEGVKTPVIILTARDNVHDTVTGLESGANDYVSKPFQFAELLARVRLRLREEPSGGEPVILRSGDIALDLRTRRVEVDGCSNDLTSREFALLEVLLRHPSQVLSREQILGHVWGYDFDPGSNVVDVYVRSLRKKIGPDRIETVRGAGYRLL